MATEESLTRKLIETLWAWKYEDFSEEELRVARSLFLDHIACAACGSQVESGKIMREHVLGDLGQGSPEYPIIGAKLGTFVTSAAVANSQAAASYEFDDTHTGGQVHPGAVIYPAAIAGTMFGGGDEKTFIRAVIIGYEVMCRVAVASNPSAHRRRHFQPTATAGHFGAAAAAAVGLGLDVDQAVAALTLSGTVAGGSMQFLLEGAWTKQVHPAFAVQRGIQGAQLAKRGFPGVKDPIAGKRAFLNAASDAPLPEALLAGLNEVPREITNTGVKAYPSCRNTNGPIDLVLQLCREHDLKADEVASITFGLVAHGIITVWEPVEQKRRPSNSVEAQFSMPYCAAVAILDGTVGPQQFRVERLSDPQVLELIDLTECVNDPELDKRYPAHWPAWLKITTKDGRLLEASTEFPSGDPSNPLSDEGLMEKFVNVSGDVYSQAERLEIQQAVLSLPGPGALDRLVKLI